MNRDGIESRLRRQRLPDPPEGLARRVLEAAEAVAAPRAIAWSDRIWYSRPARLAWSAAVLLLLAAELARVPELARDPRRAATARSSAAADLASELMLDPSWSERLLATESASETDAAEVRDVGDAL
jgi:hypothetical protein